MVVKIKDIPINERPCERLILNGSENLSSEELLAIILRTGLKGTSSKELASYLLSSIGGIKKLRDITFESLKKIKGIGKNKACSIMAMVELGKRINQEIDNLQNVRINSSNLVFKYYKDKLGYKKQEYFYAIYLDTSKRFISEKSLFIGTINYSVVHPREVFKEAYLNGASAIICVHNHPSGNVIPSKQDLEVTNNLINVGKILGIKVLDHIIISKNNYYSFLENGDISI